MTNTCYNYCKKVFVFIIVLLFYTIGYSQIIKRKAVDASTGESLVGATAKLEGTAYVTLVKLDGTYNFSKITAGKYLLTITYTGYRNMSEVAYVTVDANEIKVINLSLQSLAALKLTSTCIGAG